MEEEEEKTPVLPTTLCSTTVCKFTDIKENGMKMVKIHNDAVEVLLIKQKGEILGIGPYCPHYGAPLNTGALGVGRIRCPWHGACFSTRTGDIEDYPGLDSIPTYKVKITIEGMVQVSLKSEGDLNNDNVRMKEMTPYFECDKRVFIIIGGGPSAAVCAETLRQEGYSGRIVILCKEKFPPYDRTQVSKRLTAGIKELRLREPIFYTENGIEVLTNSAVLSLDTRFRIACYKSGKARKSIRYDKLYIATGSIPFIPDIPNSQKVDNVITIRELADSRSLQKNLQRGKKIAIWGTSFIAMEVASYLATRVSKVFIIGKSAFPYQAIVGEQVGKRILELCSETDNIEFCMSTDIDKIQVKTKGKKKKKKKILKAIVLQNEKRIPCHILIIATGATPNTEFLTGSGIKINKDGTITTDKRLMTNVEHVYAGGDIANAPIFSVDNQRASVKHYEIAQYHGHIAGINMAGGCKALHVVPFFTTNFFGINFRYAGFGDFVDVYIEGDLEELDFNAYYLDDDDFVVAVVTCGDNAVAASFAELQWQGQRLHRLEVTDRTIRWQDKLHKRDELDLNKCKLLKMECLRNIY